MFPSFFASSFLHSLDIAPYSIGGIVVASYTSFNKCIDVANEKAKKRWKNIKVEKRVKNPKDVEKCWVANLKYVVLVLGIENGKRKCLAVIRKA